MRGQILGKYRLLHALAAGGMGEVFLAEQEGPSGFRRVVVVKRLLRHLASDPGFVEMFLQEGKLAAQIAHPNVAQVIELGESGGTYFIAMEYVRGRSLREILKGLQAREEKMPPLVAVAIMIGVLRGLHAAHTLVDDEGNPRGCIHRDVSAENVLLSVDGTVKLVDFGIAKALSASTVKGTQLRGKYGYMAPEQYLHGRLDARTDVFACGVLLYELLVGERPFTATSEAAIMNAILTSPPPSLQAAIGCSPRLEAIVEAALAKDPEARVDSAERLAGALEALVISSELGSADIGVALRGFARTVVQAPDVSESPPRGVSTEPLAEGVAHASSDPTTTVVEERREGQPDPRRRRLVVGAVAIGLSAAAMVFALHRSPEPAASSSAASTPAPPAASSLAVSPPSEPSSVVAIQAHEPPPSSSARVTASVRSGGGSPTRVARHAATSADKAAGVGTLAFRIRPWAEIFVDGRSIGVSPVSPVELAAGSHQVLLRNKTLARERTMTAQVVRGETTMLRVDLME